MKLSFTKMQGCANDYIYLDCRDQRRAGGHRSPFAEALPPPLFHRRGRHHLHLRPGDGGRGRADAHLQRRRQRGADVRQRRALRGRMALHPRRCQRDAPSSTPTAAPRPSPTGAAQLWQVEMGGYSAMAAALPAVNMGEGPLVDCPLTVEGRTWRVTCISVGNPHCVTVVEDVDCLKLEDIGPAFEQPRQLPGAGQHRVRGGGGLHPPENAGVGAGQRRDMGLRHRHLRHRGGADRAGPLPRRRGRPCPAAGR